MCFCNDILKYISEIMFGNKFYPDNNKVSRFISSRFALQACDSGYSWKYVTPEQRQWYWDEFIVSNVICYFIVTFQLTIFLVTIANLFV